ncbi:hypothetical protein GCM10025881_04480 [Pseudolysinimonas kribbensis]|uniref:Uncharacterized protein n=1 Tax=Pseudolysinimonas kribbensis TaxID=433641 RepID=A0ABQ6K2G8_9MICO|nr:hypothetical protein GCM10025881_04480 [Pseudolysinimonas kribbensis]
MHGAGAVGGGVALLDLRDLGEPVGLEVAAGDQAEDVLPSEFAPVIQPEPSETRGSSRYRMPVADSVPSTAPSRDQGPM